MKKLLFLFLVAFYLIPSKSVAQGTAGKDFWVAFMAQDWGCYYNQYFYNNDTAELYLSSQFPANVKIKAPGQNFQVSVSLIPNVTKMVRLPREVVCRYSDSVTTNGVNIVADTTINVYAVNRYWFSKGATVVLPTSSIVLAPEYFITTASDNYAWGWYCNGKQLQSPEFTVVGLADSSVIEIVPTGASSRNSTAGVPFQITLKKGQTFQYMTTDNDLTGSIVRAKYPYSKFSVFAGNRQTYTNRVVNNVTCWSSWDHDYEQMMPTVNWGTQYTAIPFKNNKKGYTLKIVAAENNSNLYINGSYVAQLNQGKYYVHQVYSDTIVRVTSNNRISVAQFALGGGYSGGTCQSHPTKPWIGDPAQVQLFPDEQFGTSATVNTVSQTAWWWWSNNWWWLQNSPEHYINVMTKSTDTGFFFWNNKKLAVSQWKTAPNFSNYHYAQIQIDTGSHYIRSTKGFLSYVYGYGLYEGYAYAAAANFKPIQNNFVIINAQCKRDTVKFNAILNDSFGTYSWDFGDGYTDTGARVKHKYRDTGWYNVRMFCKQKRTNAYDTVTKSLYVADTKIHSLFNADTAICGKVDIIVISKGFYIDNEYTWNDGHPVYYRSIKNPGIYWLEVKERNGCVFRDTLKITNSTIPQANFTLSNDQFCLNRNINVKFNNQSSYKDSIKNFRWDFGDTIVYTTDTNTVVYHKFKKANMYPVVLRAETKFGCYHDTFMTVDVLPSPKSNFTFTKKDTCFNTNGIELKNNTVPLKSELKRYKWYFSEGFNLSNNNPGPRTYSNPGNYKVYLIYEYNNGCIDTMIQNVKVVANPKAGFTFPNATYCSLDSIPFTSTTTGNGRPFNFTWSWGDNTTSKDSVAKKAFTKIGNTSVKLFVLDKFGCKDSIVKSMFINETPVVDFTINKDTQCFSGHSFNFVNSTKFSGGSLNYSWTLGDGNNSTDSNVLNKTYAKDSVYSVKLATTTSVGCNASKTRSVYLGGYPDARFTINKDTQCFKGNVFSLTNASTIQRGVLSSYVWQFGNGDTSHRINILNYRYKTEDTFTIKLIGMSNLGCYDTASARVVTFAQSKAAFNIPNPIQCKDQNGFAFNNTSVIKYGSIAYQWSFGDNTSSSLQSPFKSYSSYGVYQVRLITTTNHNCKDTITVPVTVNASPLAAFNINSDKQCSRNNRFVFSSNSGIAQGSIARFDWMYGDNTKDSGANVSKQYLVEDSLTVRLVVTSDRGCKDTIDRPIVVFPQPKALFAVNSDIQCFKQQKFVLTNKSQIKYGQLTYNWNFGDGKTSTDTNYIKTYAIDSTYNVRLITASGNNCKDTAYKSLTLYPSPNAKFIIDKDTQCFTGNVFNFVNQSNTPRSTISSYDWNMDDGNTFLTPGISKYSFKTEDTFIVTLVVTNNRNCTDTFVKPAVTFAQPVVSFTVPNDSQCWQKNYFIIKNNTKLKYGKLSNTWDFGDKTQSTEFVPSTKKYPNKSASYTIRYKAVSDHGCSDSAQHRIILFERPVSDFSINDSIQCFRGHLFSFANTTTFSVMSTLSYRWDYANGNKNTGFTPQDATYSAPGKYNVQLITYSSLTNCADTAVKVVIPAPHANVGFTMNNDSQCFRYNKFVMNNGSTVQFGSMTYNWHFGDNTSDTASNPVKSYKTEGAYKVKLVVTTNYQCADSISKSIGFYATPKAAFDIDDSLQCLNAQAFGFSDKTSLSRGNYTPAWWFDDNTSASGSTVSNKTFTQSDWHWVRLSVITDKSCVDTVMRRVYLENHYNSGIVFNEKDSQCLKGNLFNFKQQNNNSKVTYTAYQWVYGDGQQTTQAVPSTMSFTKDGHFKVMLATVSALGCNDTAYADILIHPHPVTRFSADPVCYPEPVVFKNTSAISSGTIDQYIWDMGDATQYLNQYPSHKYLTSGTYNVRLQTVSNYGCRDTLVVNSAAVVKEKPVAKFSFEVLPALQQDQTRLQMKNESSATSSRYFWDFGNQTNSSEFEPIAIYQDTGRWKITLVSYTTEGCSDTFRLNTGQIVPDFVYFLPSAFSPNSDNHNELYKGYGTLFAYKFKLEIYNRWGEKLWETDDITKGWDGYYQGELCMEGTYLCRVQIVPFKGTMKYYEQMFMLLR